IQPSCCRPDDLTSVSCREELARFHPQLCVRCQRTSMVTEARIVAACPHIRKGNMPPSPGRSDPSEGFVTGPPTVGISVAVRARCRALQAPGIAMAKAETSRHRFSLGSLGVLPFELQPLFLQRRCIRTGEQGRMLWSKITTRRMPNGRKPR